jgi:hypothetical protein
MVDVRPFLTYTTTHKDEHCACTVMMHSRLHVLGLKAVVIVTRVVVLAVIAVVAVAVVAVVV